MKKNHSRLTSSEGSCSINGRVSLERLPIKHQGSPADTKELMTENFIKRAEEEIKKINAEKRNIKIKQQIKIRAIKKQIAQAKSFLNKKVFLFLFGILISIFIIASILAPPPNPEIRFKDRNGNLINANIIIERRNDGLYNLFINFTNSDYSLNQINITGLVFPRISKINLSIGEYRREPPNPEWYIEEADTHLFGAGLNLTFETAKLTLRKDIPDEEIKFLLECENWDTETFICLSNWTKSLNNFTQDNQSITFTTNHLSGWTGTSFMYDDFETANVSDYCQTSNATSAGWTGRVCHTGNGSFLVDDFPNCYSTNFNDVRCGNLTTMGNGARLEVYKDSVSVGTKSQRVYFKTDCNYPVTIPASATSFWIMMTSSNDTAGTGRLFIGFNNTEYLTCGGYVPSLFECSGVSRQQVTCGIWHYIELYTNDLTNNLTCFYDGNSFCSEQGVRTIPGVRYGVLGKGAGSANATTGTIFYDEYRFSSKLIGGYPNISNVIEKKDPINDREEQQINATVIDFDGNLDTVTLSLQLLCEEACPILNYSPSGNVGNEYYFNLSEDLFNDSQQMKYQIYANDSNAQIIRASQGEVPFNFFTNNCAVPSPNWNWNVTRACNVSSDFDLGTGNLIKGAGEGNLTWLSTATGTINKIIAEVSGIFIKINSGVTGKLNSTG